MADQQISNPMAEKFGDARTLCKRAWWVFLIGGIALLIFGILAFYNPAVALLVLSVYFAASVLVDGVVNIVGAIQNRARDGWWVVLLIGILGTLIGAYALVYPPVSMAAFVYLVAFMAIMAGVFLVMLGRKVREKIDREWILYLTGALSIIWGVLIIVQPAPGAVSVVYMIASWAVIFGIMKIFFAFKARSFTEHVGEKLADRAAGQV